MEQVGRIISTDGEMATLEVKRVGGCGTNCAACNVACNESAELMTIPNIVHGEVGDFIEIASDSGAVKNYYLLVYGVPLVLFIASLVLGHFIFNENTHTGQLYSFGLGVLSFVISHFIIKSVDNKHSSSQKAHMVRNLSK